MISFFSLYLHRSFRVPHSELRIEKVVIPAEPAPDPDAESIVFGFLAFLVTSHQLLVLSLHPTPNTLPPVFYLISLHYMAQVWHFFKCGK